MPRRRLARLLILALLPLVAVACAAGGPLPAPQTDTSLHRTVWATADAPAAVMLALHGYGDHAVSVFSRPAPVWAEAGIAVHAFDQRGFGHNADHGYWPGVDRLVADAIAETVRLRETYPDTPLILLGHSMGGGVALAAMAEGAPADAAVLVAPAIGGGSKIGPLRRAGLWSVTRIAPDWRWSGGGLIRLQASDNIEVLRGLAADPLHIGAPNPREITGLVRIMDRATAGAPTVTQPVLVLLGERDEFIDNAAAAAVAETIPGLDRIIRYPDGWHLLMRDLQAETVWADIAAWIAEAR